ncbi:MAG: recombination protein RecR [Candidatus Moranbacteria bacterium]|nr:recombination protein RecR [Candidatus Moranbacteria bacterium]
MYYLPKNFQTAVEHISQLPAIGPRMAERLVLHLIRYSKSDLQALARSIANLSANQLCLRCHNLSDQDLCHICSDSERDSKTICVVENILDLMAIENKKIYQGFYHVLGGVIKIGQKDNTHNLKIKELAQRVKKEKPTEVIIATNPTTAGDLTASLLVDILKNFPKLKTTRINRGVATGTELEYADPHSLKASFQTRQKI